MAIKNEVKKQSKLKPLLVVVGILVGVYLLFMGIMFASDWIKIKPYKALATELNQTLGGGYKINYNWRCELESSNCPSALLTKDVSNGSDVDVQSKLQDLTSKLDTNRFTIRSMGKCNEADKYGYCRTEIKDNTTTLVITISLRSEIVFIDIQP